MPDGRPATAHVIGLGNELRRDDGVGVITVRDLLADGTEEGIEIREQQGEPIALLDAWRPPDAVVLVDAVCSGATPGTVTRLDGLLEPMLEPLRRSSSTHAVSVAEALALARALDGSRAG